MGEKFALQNNVGGMPLFGLLLLSFKLDSWQCPEFQAMAWPDHWQLTRAPTGDWHRPAAGVSELGGSPYDTMFSWSCYCCARGDARALVGVGG